MRVTEWRDMAPALSRVPGVGCRVSRTPADRPRETASRRRRSTIGCENIISDSSGLPWEVAVFYRRPSRGGPTSSHGSGQFFPSDAPISSQIGLYLAYVIRHGD